MPENVEDFSEDELEEILQSKMVQKYLAYRNLTDGITTLKNDDVMYDQLVKGIESRVTQNLAQSTIRNVLDALVEEVESNTGALEEAENEEQAFL
jgi:hypothetical protein